MYVLKFITRNVTNTKSHHQEVKNNDKQFGNIPCLDNVGRDNLSAAMVD